MSHPLVRRFGGWMLAALVITLPGSLSLSGSLIGSSEIDVWNHAWGFWYIAEAIAHLEIPYMTHLVGAPTGGVVWFIDPVAGFSSLGVTWLFGPAVAYNLAVIVRLAMTGFAAQLLTEEVSGEGSHTWFAGLAYAFSPFLLTEVENGITEACNLSGIAFTLWAALRALRRQQLSDVLLTGFFLGATAATSFYLGLATGISLAAMLLFHSASLVFSRRGLVAMGMVLALSAAVSAPLASALRSSIHHEEALVSRSEGLNELLLEHNAVDPQGFFRPHHVSVDLEAVYGESLKHTAYLRWSILLLAALALRRRGLRYLAGVGAVSLLMSLGPKLWWNGGWLTFENQQVALPFAFIQTLVPGLGITHPLRLSIGTLLASCVLAGAGLQILRNRWPAHGRLILWGTGLAVAVETAAEVPEAWPLSRSPTAIPAIYDDLPVGPVLDLPSQVGFTMTTHRYFWYQTSHHRPVPYLPELRESSARDPLTFSRFADLCGGAMEGAGDVDNTELSSATVEHLRATFGTLVYHQELAKEAGCQDRLEHALTQAFGEPDREEPGYWAWFPEPIDNTE